MYRRISPFTRIANSRRRKEIEAALAKLCRDGVLVLGLKGEEPTFKITKKFDRCLKGSARAMFKAGIPEKDFLGDLAVLSLVNWYNGLEEKEACSLSNALMGVFLANLEERP